MFSNKKVITVLFLSKCQWINSCTVIPITAAVTDKNDNKVRLCLLCAMCVMQEILKSILTFCSPFFFFTVLVVNWCSPEDEPFFLFHHSISSSSSRLSRSSDWMRGAEQPSGQVHGDDAVAEGALPSGPGQHAAPRLQSEKHRGVSWAGHLCRYEHHCITAFGENPSHVLGKNKLSEHSEDMDTVLWF